MHSVLKTLIYFDLHDYPLTFFELWQFSSEFFKLDQLQEILNNPEISNEIETKNGFYFLRGRENLIRKRLERYNFSNQKFKIAKRVAYIFHFIPWIKMIALSNIIGSHNLRKEGDLDFFIITQKNRIWLTRFFCVLIAQIFGLRPNKKNSQDKVCLSFFIDEENLNLESLMLKDDLYFACWLIGLRVLYDQDNTYDQLMKVSKDWLKKFFPNYEINFKEIKNKIKKSNQFFNQLEKRIKSFQIKIMPENLKNLANKNTNVIINDNIVKLHVNDRRLFYQEEFNKRIYDFS